MRVLVDSSSLIALAKIDGFHVLERLFGTVYITMEVKDEVLKGDSPDIATLKERIGKTIVVTKARKTGHFKGLKGIADGERSLLEYAKEEGDVILVLDETEARAIAQAEGLKYTGTIGLLVSCHEKGKITREEALALVKKLSRTDFRMTVELYDWAMEKLG